MARSQGMMVKLPPGFRFHPTDEELVVEYLKRKAFSFPLPASVIPEIQISRFDPWDLPGGSERERYFFSAREIKYRNGKRPNRASIAGYWKATGKDKQIVAKGGNQIVGAKKTLVFYRGKAPAGERTDWIMHEYRLAGALQEQPLTREWVLCRIFRKRRSSTRTTDRADLVDSEAGSDAEPSCVTEINGEAGDGDDSCCSSR
ncbi:NAC domain-containing protein 83-like [Wolffia australiana]